MRPLSFLRASTLIVLFGFALQSALAQAPSPSPTASPTPPAPVRDAQAIATVQAAIAAMGGTVAVAAIQDTSVQGTIQDQGSSGSPTQSFTWMSSGGQFRTQVATATDTRIYVSGYGSPVDQEDGVNTAIPFFVAQANLPYEVPALVLLNEVNNPNYTLSYVGTTTINGNPAIHVHACDDTDYTSYLVTPQEWYFDASTGLPVRVEYLLPQNTTPQNSWSLSIDFANYTATGGILVPYQLTMNAGPVVEIATVNSVAFNSGLSASLFAAPSGGAQ